MDYLIHMSHVHVDLKSSLISLLVDNIAFREDTNERNI